MLLKQTVQGLTRRSAFSCPVSSAEGMDTTSGGGAASAAMDSEHSVDCGVALSGVLLSVPSDDRTSGDAAIPSLVPKPSMDRVGLMVSALLAVGDAAGVGSFAWKALRSMASHNSIYLNQQQNVESTYNQKLVHVRTSLQSHTTIEHGAMCCAETTGHESMRALYTRVCRSKCACQASVSKADVRLIGHDNVTKRTNQPTRTWRVIACTTRDRRLPILPPAPHDSLH